MSDSITTDTPLITWSDGMTDDAEKALVGHAEKSGASILESLRKGDRAMHAVCKEAERVHRLYLRGDKARLTLYFGQDGPLGTRGVAWQTAYGWIQAGRVLRTFAAELKSVNDRDPIGVKVLAMYDRFTVNADTQGAGREAIAREISAAVEEDRAMFTNSPKSVASTIKAPVAVAEGETAPSEAEAAATRESNRIGRIVGKLTEGFGEGFAAFQVSLASELGMPIADLRKLGVGTFGLATFTTSTKLGATWGSANGGSTGQAVDRCAETVSALAVTQAAKALADQKALEAATASALSLVPEVKPEATVTPVAVATVPAEKRAGRGSGKNVAVATRKPKAKAIPRGFVSDPTKVDRKTGETVK